jgi:DNA-binding response OmpR family regulator
MAETFDKHRAPAPPAGPRVLVVDDEPPICQTLHAVLGADGLQTQCASNLASARQMLESDYRLIILDLLFPDGNGFELLRWLKIDQRRSTPVIVLSQVTKQEAKLRAFEMGVDDYIVKPFAVRELAARVSAVLRRCYGNDVISFGPFRIDLTARTLQRGTVPIHLRPKEFDMLALLASRPGEALSREELVHAIWGDKPLAARQAVAVAVHSLRDKLEESQSKPRYIRTVSRYGYRFDPGT